MSAFLGIAGYEYRMGVRRWGLWLAFVVAGIPFFLNPLGGHDIEQMTSVWQMAASAALMANLLLPVVAGIAMADRLERDMRLGVRELQSATPLPRLTYVLAKYVGAVLVVATPSLLVSLAVDGVMVAQGAPVTLFGASLAAFAAINLVAYLFVGAFALACPLVMPVRVFQVLVTGYWIWGNFLSPQVMPTLSETLLTASGRWVAGGLFGMPWYDNTQATPLEAIVNLALIGLAATAALLALGHILERQSA